VLGGASDVLSDYQAAAGAVGPRAAVLELFDVWWGLAEIASYVEPFRQPHVDSEDSRESWQILTKYVPE
jgi:spectinomycin phosphotransferase